MKQPTQKAQKESAFMLSLSNPKNIFIAALIILVAFLIWYRADDRDDSGSKSPIVEEGCPLERDPVCGIDGKTYSNACTAQKVYKATIAYDGECRAEVDGQVASDTGSTNTGSEVDSGIENLASVPATMEDRPDQMNDSNRETMSASGQSQSGSDLLEYSNAALRYAFNMPKKSYYAAFGPQDGASHTVGIATGAGVESFSDAPVRVYFYANTVLDELESAPNGFYADSKTGNIFLLLDDTSSVRIESDGGETGLVNTIVRTIHRTQ